MAGSDKGLANNNPERGSTRVLLQNETGAGLSFCCGNSHWPVFRCFPDHIVQFIRFDEIIPVGTAHRKSSVVGCVWSKRLKRAHSGVQTVNEVPHHPKTERCDQRAVSI